MNKLFLLLLSLLIFNYTFSQEANKQLLSKVTIKNNKGVDLENKNLIVVYSNMNEDRDIKSCTDIMLLPSRGNTLETFGGLSCILNYQSWTYSAENSDNSKKIYKTSGRLNIIDNQMNSYEVVKEVLLIKYSNGLQTIRINAFDNKNSIEITL